MVGGIESTLKIGCTVIDMLIIDRVGRRLTLIVGCLVMSLALLVCPYANNREGPFFTYSCFADKWGATNRIPKKY